MSAVAVSTAVAIPAAVATTVAAANATKTTDAAKITPEAAKAPTEAPVAVAVASVAPVAVAAVADSLNGAFHVMAGYVDVGWAVGGNCAVLGIDVVVAVDGQTRGRAGQGGCSAHYHQQRHGCLREGGGDGTKVESVSVKALHLFPCLA